MGSILRNLTCAVLCGQRVRWGCVSAYTILKRHEDAFNSLVEAMGRGASIPECVQILEESGNTEE